MASTPVWAHQPPKQPHLGGPLTARDEPLKQLSGRSILIVEDESLIALLLLDALEEAGASVVGPCYTLAECIRFAKHEHIDAAVLDVDLAGEDVFPAADELRSRGIPFLFHTGHAYRSELQSRYGGVTVCRKPTAMTSVVDLLERLIDRHAPN